MVRNSQKINSSFNNCSLYFLKHDYTEEDEKDELLSFNYGFSWHNYCLIVRTLQRDKGEL